MNYGLTFEHFICPICHELLLDPVVAKDGIVYNRQCFETYTNTVEPGDQILSPVTKELMSRGITKVTMIRTIIIDLMKSSNIFDDYII